MDTANALRQTIINYPNVNTLFNELLLLNPIPTPLQGQQSPITLQNVDNFIVSIFQVNETQIHNNLREKFQTIQSVMVSTPINKQEIAKMFAKQALNQIHQEIASDNNTVKLINSLEALPQNLKPKQQDMNRLIAKLGTTINTSSTNIMANITLVIKCIKQVKSKLQDQAKSSQAMIYDAETYLKSIESKIKAEETLSSQVEQIPQLFFRENTNIGPQIQKKVVPSKGIFTDTLYNETKIFHEMPDDINDLPQIHEYKFNSPNGQQIAATQNPSFLESVQNIVYTKLMDSDFMRSDPDVTMFWSHCDLKGDDIANSCNGIWKDICKKQIWIDKVQRRNAANPLPPNIEGATISSMVAYSLRRRPLVDVWKSNDLARIPGNAVANRAPFNELSRTFAERASGVVIFASGDKDAEGRYGDTWENIERPALMANNNVTMIIEIDIKNPDCIKTITFPHGITPQIKAQYPMFKDLKAEIREIDYISQPVKYKDIDGNNLPDPHLARPLHRRSASPAPLHRKRSLTTLSVVKKTRSASPAPSKSNLLI